MAIYYSSLYKQNPIRATLYEAVGTAVERAGVKYTMRFTATLPVGFTVADVMKLAPFQSATPTATPQIAGVKPTRLVYRTSGNAGGAVTANVGYASAGATAFGSAVTTLQSAATTEIAVATMMAGPSLLVNDDLQIVGVANTTTTAITIDGFVDFDVTAP